jgi:hypothetical protein
MTKAVLSFGNKSGIKLYIPTNPAQIPTPSNTLSRMEKLKKLLKSRNPSKNPNKQTLTP